MTRQVATEHEKAHFQTSSDETKPHAPSRRIETKGGNPT
jgi:hypothetical protein